MNADVRIDTIISSKVRQEDVEFKPTITYNADFHWYTDLDNYPSIVDEIETTILQYCYDEQQKGAEITVHVGVRVDNVTHPTPAAGVIPLPKQHIDMTWSQGDLADTVNNDISVSISTTIANLRGAAKY